MTESIDNVNEINGGFGKAMQFAKKTIGTAKDAMGTAKNAMTNAYDKLPSTSALKNTASKISNARVPAQIKDFGSFMYNNTNFYVALFALNLILRLVLISTQSLFKGNKYYVGQYKKHVRESFGITLIITMFFAFIYISDKENFTGSVKEKGDLKDKIQFAVFTIILFSIFMYDYVNLTMMLIKNKYFGKKVQTQLILTQIMRAIITGIFVLYYITIAISKVPIKFDNETNSTFYIGSFILVASFAVSIIGFFIIRPNIMEESKKMLRENDNSRKEFFIEMFKIYYIIFIVVLCLSITVFYLNKQKIYELLP